MTKTNIILTGMPGSGKSTVGVILAKERCMDFIDTDVLIQTGEGMTLQEIIDTRGLDAFLELEQRYVMNPDVSNAVIAPGGSVVLYEKAMVFLKHSGIIVFLEVPLNIIRKRIDIYSRGMVKQPHETLEDVWRKREPLYRAYADIVVDCKSMDQMEIAQYIVHTLESFH